MYLMDTNIWLERLLDQARSEEVGNFLKKVTSEHLYITDFSFHSIGIVMDKLNQKQALLKFVQDALIESEVGLIHLEPTDMGKVVEIMDQAKLDFDDAYQYVAAEQYRLTLISFDKDFDKTPLGRKEPKDILG
ncbi:MAG: type II toxin-antitoxin system VapC family toxin [Candidatus Marinimicrobia bacterium]|nr:type II toxin-antitoxin system VapC family toxin [Candidatus Neomarinimicrobiota bacterium]